MKANGRMIVLHSTIHPMDGTQLNIDIHSNKAALHLALGQLECDFGE